MCVTHLLSREHFHANYDERVRTMELNSSLLLSFFLSLSRALVKEEEEEERMNESDDKKMTI